MQPYQVHLSGSLTQRRCSLAPDRPDGRAVRSCAARSRARQPGRAWSMLSRRATGPRLSGRPAVGRPSGGPPSCGAVPGPSPDGHLRLAHSGVTMPRFCAQARARAFRLAATLDRVQHAGACCLTPHTANRVRCMRSASQRGSGRHAWKPRGRAGRAQPGREHLEARALQRVRARRPARRREQRQQAHAW